MLVVKNLTTNAGVMRLRFDPWVRKIPWRAWQSTSCILAWRIPWTKEPGKLQSIGLHRVGHDWRDLAHTHMLLSKSYGNQRLRNLGASFLKQYRKKYWLIMGMFYIERYEIAASVAQKMVQYWQFHEIRANKKKKTWADQIIPGSLPGKVKS